MTFDTRESERLKEEGMALAREHRAVLLERARLIALSLAWENGTVTSDDVYRRMSEEGLDPDGLGPAAGSVFRRDFEFTGQWKRSTRVANHASDLRVWRLRSLKPTG